MITRYILPLLAVAGVGFAIFTVVQARQAPPISKPQMSPPTPPSGVVETIAGAGLVEARSENIPVGSPVPGVVEEIYVERGQRVRAGDPLFRLETRDLEAERKVRQAELAAAESELHKLRASPRPEDVPPAEAAVEEAKARLEDTKVIVNRNEQLFFRNAATASEYDAAKYSYSAAKAALSKAEAELARIQAGAWEEDILVAEAQVAQAQSQLERINTEIERRTIRALVGGEVLQLNVRPGQFAAVLWNEPMVVLGDVEKLHVRVDLDEQDIPRFRAGLSAIAYLKGEGTRLDENLDKPRITFPLEFVRVEPYVIPKRSLTGDNSERVDTRVLQVIYSMPNERSVPVFVGQQMDVFLYLEEPTESSPGLASR